MLLIHCLALCGNDACEPEIGENCVSCPYDCPAHTCGNLTCLMIHFGILLIILIRGVWGCCL